MVRVDLMFFVASLKFRVSFLNILVARDNKRLLLILLLSVEVVVLAVVLSIVRLPVWVLRAVHCVLISVVVSLVCVQLAGFRELLLLRRFGFVVLGYLMRCWKLSVLHWLFGFVALLSLIARLGFFFALHKFYCLAFGFDLRHEGHY